MSSLMNRLLCTYLLILCCFTLACVCGGGQDSFPTCEVELRVRRGTTLKTTPRQRVTAKCPVKYCGESVSVTWCKLLDSDKCERINDTETVQLTDKRVNDELISYLTFKRISIHDDGLYRCYLKGFKEEIVSHAINISVSNSFPSCEVELRVRRGTTLKVTPRQRVTAKCPVKYCGESVSVTWCKLLDSDKCERINDTETVQLTDKRINDELISFLTFKRISIHDDGLYRCYLKGFKEEIISHAINISVSNSKDHGVTIPEYIPDESPRVAVHKDLSWLPYFYIYYVVM